MLKFDFRNSLATLSGGVTWAQIAAVACTATAVTAPALFAAEPRPMTFEDLMRFRQIRQPVLSEQGGWLAYSLEPDRGDGEGLLRSTDGRQVYRIERGIEPQLSADGNWAAFEVQPTFEALEQADKESDKDQADAEEPKAGLALVATAAGATESFERVESFVFSGDGAWLAIHHFPVDKTEEPSAAAESRAETVLEEPATEPGASEVGGTEVVMGEQTVAATAEEATGEAPRAAEAEEPATASKDEGEPLTERGLLRLRHLASGREFVVEQVRELAFDQPAPGTAARFLAWVVDGPDTAENGLFVRPLQVDAEPLRVVGGEEAWQGELSWAAERSRLAFLSGRRVDSDDIEEIGLDTWSDSAGLEARLADGTIPAGWQIPSANELQWSRDGERLFFGLRPEDEEESAEESAGEEAEDVFDPYDQPALIESAEVDVWHWDDPYINPHQKRLWKDREERLFRAVVHLNDNSFVQLADLELPEVDAVDNPRFALGRSDVPYRKLMTWEGRFYDFWVIDLVSGARHKVASKVGDDKISLSPGGGFVAWFQDRHWWLYDTAQGASRKLTDGLEVSFANEDHDYPAQVPGYGVADWTVDDQSLLLYDKFDLWQLPTEDGEPLRLTSGRPEGVVYRSIDLDEDREGLEPGEELLLLAYHDRQKHNAWARAKVGEAGTRTLYEVDKRLAYHGRARHADRLLFSRQSHAEFPDLWTAGLDLKSPRRLSEANPQMAELAWGSPELVEWTSLEGEPLQGVLIKPPGYREGQRYPVLVYYYRFFSQRLFEFNEPVINHRPSFPLYASNGYAVFLPDIRFEVGRPGLSATRSLVPGVQKLIEMGIADPQRIGLHGHSWSGYQTAFIITQTDLFAAAVAGAPVSNMTSAYGGVRYTSGLARQFQYEQGQSRLGGSLWEKPWAYLENSPLFFADKIDTPLLIQFGDEDGAVPWTQGIELYLALRRLGKPAIFLQYRGEGHHLKKYANKLDYASRMKAYFDHYLKGEPAAAWITEGEPYDGD